MGVAHRLKSGDLTDIASEIRFFQGLSDPHIKYLKPKNRNKKNSKLTSFSVKNCNSIFKKWVELDIFQKTSKKSDKNLKNRSQNIPAKTYKR